jgi:hypothetical protein
MVQIIWHGRPVPGYPRLASPDRVENSGCRAEGNLFFPRFLYLPYPSQKEGEMPLLIGARSIDQHEEKMRSRRLRVLIDAWSPRKNRHRKPTVLMSQRE